MGKGWAKGLTAATDPRVARAAAAHRGLVYAIRPTATDLRKVTLAAAPQWSPEMAYVVGLSATDGCLISGRRQINFKSADRDLVALYLALLHRTNSILTETSRTGGIVYNTQFGDAALYRWFEGVGLTPRKSLTLGPLEVPDRHLIDVARGLFDGDGTIINATYRADSNAKRPYYWEYLVTRFYSASRTHLEWLRERLASALSISGGLSRSSVTRSGNSLWALSFAKRASIVLLSALYGHDDAPCLMRKKRVWLDYAVRHDLGPT